MASNARARAIRAALLVAAVVGAMSLLWVKGVRPQFVPKRFDVVETGTVYRSGEATPSALRRVVKARGIRTVIDLGANEPGTEEEQSLAAAAAEAGVRRVVFDLEGDGTGNPNAYLEALRIMADPASRPVWVHCGAGTERTGIVVALYRHIVQGVPLTDGLQEAIRAGHSPRRNPRLKPVLMEWAPEIERAFRDGGPLRGVEPLATAQEGPPP